jgi:membrane fusion protein (multidrug efflux system)
MTSRSRFAFQGIVLLLSVVAISCGKSQSESAAQREAPPVPVVIGQVEQRTVPLTTELTARLKGSETVELRARVEGFLTTAAFEEGRPVRKDQVVFRIDPRNYEARVQAAKSRLTKAQADLRLAQENVRVKNAEAQLEQALTRQRKSQTDVKRLEPLAKEMAVPQQDLDNAVADLDVAKSNVDSSRANLDDVKLSFSARVDEARAAVLGADAELKQAELDLSYCEIRSPIDGIIGTRLVDVGNLVGRGEPTLLSTISTVNPIRVTFSIPEREYLRLVKRYSITHERATGAVLSLILADNSVFPQKGRLIAVERAVDEKTGTLSLQGQFSNPDAVLRPGQFARVRLATDQIEDAVLVPQRAVFSLQSTQVAYVVGNDNKVAVRSLQIRGQAEDHFIVAEGLKPGERVIVEGIRKVRPGQAVTPAGAPMSVERGK